MSSSHFQHVIKSSYCYNLSMKKLVSAAVLAVSLASSPGCRYFMPKVEEPIRIQNADDIDASGLGFVRGKTAFGEAEAAMRRKGLTGISKTVYTDITAPGRSPVLNAIAADYQSSVHVFLNDAYLESVKLHNGPALPYGPTITISSGAGAVLLLALYRDALDITERRDMAAEPRIDVFEQRGGRFSFRSAMRLGDMAAENNGISRPIFVGHDLDAGVLLIARDRDGVIWDGGYFIRLERGMLKTSRVSLDDASRCSCVQRYIYGESVESLWDQR